jgi:hypothetical protein
MLAHSKKQSTDQAQFIVASESHGIPLIEAIEG